MFAAYGTVSSCDLVLDSVTGKSKGFGFVEMPDNEEAQNAMQAIDGMKGCGGKIRVRKKSK